MKGKWTTVLAAAAFVLAVFALTPVGNATKSLIAPNADKVDGIHASKTAKAGMLLPLGKNAKLPASVIPTVIGLQGARIAYGTAAAMSNAQTVIVACQNQTNGLLRVVTDATDCRTGETAISWNQVGPQGPPGEQGPKGDPGPAGASVATHIRSVGAVTTGAKDELVPWQLTGASWTQKAGEIDLFYGKLTVDPPVACALGGPGPAPPGAQGHGILTVQLDGVDIGSTYVPHGTTDRIELRPYFFGASSGGAALAPDVDTPHVLTAMVKDTCDGTDENVTFDSLAIDVVSIS